MNKLAGTSGIVLKSTVEALSAVMLPDTSVTPVKFAKEVLSDNVNVFPLRISVLTPVAIVKFEFNIVKLPPSVSALPTVMLNAPAPANNPSLKPPTT
ncbi:hypothetical protein SDC9_107019 [bioreactor metagenome]|uniref:Uncharacterized protein n=1 Tax=bioreactor metagenome TaxID=1076179 RepID=A0A645B6C8_9ZZZZ